LLENALALKEVKIQRLIQLGYDPSVASRIAAYRPDVFELITSPDVRITPRKLIVRPDIVSTFSRDKWFSSQAQDRNLITVYRGLKGTGSDYDPAYYHAWPYIDLPEEMRDVSDPRIFTIDDLASVSRYPERGTVILRMQIPRFMLYTSEGGPWGLVYFRDMVPNDLVFVNGVAFIKPDAPKEIEPEFISLEEALSRLPQARLNPPRFSK
jgi:hypothetical protein